MKSYDNGVMSGYLQHPRLETRAEFQSLTQMILIMDSLLELEKCPNPPLPLVYSEGGCKERIAVFRIQIFLQEHYTWQGRLIWQDVNQEAIFHSVLELLQLLDEILA
ncbi:MAG: hypothetical protein NC432_03030 [Roseburia sp.]|nr:hypothetical protein [Roseburia sp.]MCM1097982.1 hypothetical protein [Ruminococcus flavefaciens]